ncbi:MAG: CDP-alcohol phosphatidyltransferase family protein [Pseudomonadota bacterium]
MRPTRQCARQTSRNTTNTTPMDALDRRLNHCSNLIALVLPPAVAAAILLDASIVVALTCVVLFGGLLLGQRRRLVQHRTPPGLANLLTLFRLLLLVTVLCLFDVLTPALTFAAFAGNVMLDVIDGRIARARNETDRFGSHFDMEVDAVYVLTAGLYFHLVEGVALWVVLPGLLRYVYRLAVWGLAGGDFAERRRRYAAVIAGASFTLLCAATLLPGVMQQLALALTTLLLCGSFAISFAELFRHAAQRPSIQ